MWFRLVILFFWIFISRGNLVAQDFSARAGLSFDFGNEVKRIGLRFDFNTAYNFLQVNLTSGVYYNFSAWGTQHHTPEIKLGIGSHFGFGKKNNDINQFINLYSHHLENDYAIGYAYQYYFDWQGTSQSTGLIAFSYRNLAVITENDLLGAGKGWRDRFRTGAVKVTYRYQNFRFGINMLMYTGDYSSCTKMTNDENYPARFGYRLNDKAQHGDKSLGIISLQGDYVGPYYQFARIDLGLNSEKIRHAVQNKALHDMPFYTDRMVKRQLVHIPMLQEDGSIYTFKENQVIKPASFYYNLSLNPSCFY